MEDPYMQQELRRHVEDRLARERSEQRNQYATDFISQLQRPQRLPALTQRSRSVQVLDSLKE